jgi:hypothetical protein
VRVFVKTELQTLIQRVANVLIVFMAQMNPCYFVLKHTGTYIIVIMNLIGSKELSWKDALS